MDDRRTNQVTVAQRSQLSTLSTEQTAERVAFSAILTPAIALAAGVGVSRADRSEWMLSAYSVLYMIPHPILKRATLAAMAVADHPSKIVPAIMAEATRIQAHEARMSRYDDERTATIEATVEHLRPHPEAAEVGPLMADLLKRLEANAK